MMVYQTFTMVPWFIFFMVYGLLNHGLWFFVGPLNLKSWTHRHMMIGISPEGMTDTNQVQSSKCKCVSVCIRLANSPTSARFQTCEASYADQIRGWVTSGHLYFYQQILMSQEHAGINAESHHQCSNRSLGRSSLFPQYRVSMDLFFFGDL